MTAFYAALAGAGIGGVFALVATFLAHLLEAKREWRAQLRKNYLDLRAAVSRASWPIFSSVGHQYRLSSPDEASKWGGACRAIPDRILDMRAIVRGDGTWEKDLCRRLDAFQTMIDAALRRYLTRSGPLDETEARALMVELRAIEQLVFEDRVPPTLDVAEFDRRVDFYETNGLDAQYSEDSP